jgi:hypothetical protein
MKIADLTKRLDDLGIALRPTADGRLRYRAPRAALSAELRDAVLEHKGEILAELQRRGDDQTRSEPLYPLLLQSDLLDDTVAILCDSWPEDCAGIDPQDGARPVAYSMDELSALTTLSPETVQATHLCKQFLGGKIVAVENDHQAGGETEASSA